MALQGKVMRAPANINGFDLNRKLSHATVKQFYAQEHRFCLRYISRASDKESKSDLAEGEADAILGAGLALMAVQHYAGDGRVPTAALGAQYGKNAAANAAQAGLPAGVTISLDLKGIRRGTPAEDVVACRNAWLQAVETSGFASGVYVGADAVPTGDELYWNLHTTHYWKSGSSVPEIAHRGYQMVQYIQKGYVDRDVTKLDEKGEGVTWLIGDAAASALS